MDQAIILSFGYAIGAARQGLQRLSVAHRHEAAFSANTACRFQSMNCICDAGAANAEHQGKEFVGEWQLITEPVLSHQHPTRQPLFHGGPSVRQSRCGDLDLKNMHVTQDGVAKRDVFLKLCLKDRGWNTKSLSSSLHE
ncbi:hypothetical protein GV67_21500 [Pseudorhizobium pelagicum]|nr:hypothetical protein GV67_21500 [Pseudorhizobium pelagicum]